MSSTTNPKRLAIDDFVNTPEATTHALLNQIGHYDRILEPAAGEGAIIQAIRTWSDLKPNIDGIEISPEHASVCQDAGLEVLTGDYFEQQISPGKYDLIITNPPFSIAMEFVQHSLWLAGRKGTVAMLLRLGWLASLKRRDFHRAYPADVYVLSKRPSFSGDGKTDSADYCWLAWGPGRGGNWRVV